MQSQIIEASIQPQGQVTHDPPTDMSFDPPGVPANLGNMSGVQVDWNMQDLVWNHLPWDWDLVDDLLVDGGTKGKERCGQNGDGQV